MRNYLYQTEQNLKVDDDDLKFLLVKTKGGFSNILESKLLSLKEARDFDFTQLFYILTLERVNANFIPYYSFRFNDLSMQYAFYATARAYNNYDAFNFQLTKEHTYSNDSPVIALQNIYFDNEFSTNRLIHEILNLTKGKSYKEYVGYILKSLGIETASDYSCEELEMELLVTAFFKMIDNATDFNSIINVFNLKAENSVNSVKRALQRRDFDKVNLAIANICAASILRWFEIDNKASDNISDLFYDNDSNNGADFIKKNTLSYNIIVKQITSYLLESIRKLPDECVGICAIIWIAYARQLYKEA